MTEAVMTEDWLRIDKWLWQARFAASRSAAAELCRSGIVRVNRARVGHAHHRLRVGDIVTLPLGDGVRVVRVLALGNRRGPASEARALYQELAGLAAPPATAERLSFGPCPPGTSVI
jgi:ribosome-associated heat shock protein Hsp15